MIKVGITGGIGSGKSLVCMVFSKLGVPVYNADDSARKLMENDSTIKSDLISLLGQEIYTGNILNRSKMAGLIFNNKELLTSVNRIVHPAVAEDFQKWCVAFADHSYVVHESAILIESEIYPVFDLILLVTAPDDVRFRRVITRKGMTPEKIQLIMKNQLTDREKIVRSHRVLINDGKIPILPQILDLHAELTKSGKTQKQHGQI